MAENPVPFTHTAYVLKREGKRLKFGRWLECGMARREEKTGAVNLYIDRLPVGGFNGFVHLAPIGTRPPPPEPAEPEPRRPGESDTGQDDEADE
jgi:hypothetical protein